MWLCHLLYANRNANRKMIVCVAMLYVLFALCTPHTLWASQNPCHASFIDLLAHNPFKSHLIYTDLPKIQKQQLPQGTKDRILNHPKFRELQKLYQQGKHLYFDFLYLGQEDIYKGEYIQQSFVSNMLKFMFPKATIWTREYNTRHAKINLKKPETLYIQLNIEDIMEKQFIKPIGARFGSQNEVDQYLKSNTSSLDMVLLKKANSSYKYTNFNQYKKLFPFLDSNQTVSLYMKRSFDLNALKDLYEEFFTSFEKQGFNKFFVTTHVTSTIPMKFINHFHKRYFLSQLSKKDISSITDQEKVLIINDLIGYTPILHTLANVSVVVGPINMLEGIYTGAKVIFLEGRHHIMPVHYKPAYEHLKAIALKTNRAVHIEDFNGVPFALNQFKKMSTKKRVYPDEVVLDSAKGDALNQLINRLYFQIVTQ